MQREPGKVEKWRYELSFDTPEALVREYDKNLKFDGTFVQWADPPPIDATVDLLISPPLGLPSTQILATVVFSSGGGVGLHFSHIDANQRSTLERLAFLCRAAEQEASASSSSSEKAPEESKGDAPAGTAEGTAKHREETAPSAEAEAAKAEVTPPHPGSPAAIALPPQSDSDQSDSDQSDSDQSDSDQSDSEAAAPIVVGIGQTPSTGATQPESGGIPSPPSPTVVPLPETPEAPPLAVPVASPSGPPTTPPPASTPSPGTSVEPPGAGAAKPSAAPPAAPPPGPSFTPPQGPPATQGAQWPQSRPRPRPRGPLKPSREGSLDDTPLTKLLMELEQGRVTGRLDLQGKTAGASFFFRRGGVVRVIEKEDNPALLLGELLVKSGEIKIHERDKALEAAKAQGKLIGEEMIRLKLLDHRQLREALAHQLEARVTVQAELSGGKFTFYENVGPGKGPPSPMIYSVRALFRKKVEALKQRLPDEILKAEKEYHELYLFKSENHPEDMEEIGLDKKERRFWDQVITGAYYYREVYTLTNLSRRHTHAVVMTLYEMGLIEFKTEMAEQFRVKRLKAFFGRKQARVQKETLFGVLELHWMAVDKEIEEAYRHLKETYGLEKYKAEIPQRVKDMAADIDGKIEEAHQTLRTASGRAAYRQTIIEPDQIRFTADLLMQQGDMAAFRADFREAHDRYIHALELEPRNAEIRQKYELLRNQGGL